MNMVNNIDALPAIPYIARKILSLEIITDQGEIELLKLIEKDPPILAKIVGLSNSPLFGTSRKILSLHDAVALLGTRRIKMVALSFAMLSSLTRKPSGLLNVQRLWQHSLAIAMTMDTMAHLMPVDFRPSDDEIYLAGLLHDIGYLILDYINPSLSDEFHARLAAEPGRPEEEIEAAMLEYNHGEMGAQLARHWNLPEPIIIVLEHHHKPHDKRAEAAWPLVTMTSLSEKLLPTFCNAESMQLDINSEEWQSLGIDPLKADEIKVKVQEHVREVAAICT